MIFSRRGRLLFSRQSGKRGARYAAAPFRDRGDPPEDEDVRAEGRMANDLCNRVDTLSIPIRVHHLLPRGRQRPRRRQVATCSVRSRMSVCEGRGYPRPSPASTCRSASRSCEAEQEDIRLRGPEPTGRAVIGLALSVVARWTKISMLTTKRNSATLRGTGKARCQRV
jgi:hypothetical protein